MSDQAGLLQAIIEAPHDEASRLVYADWLEEKGDAARSAFIRAQCQLARCCHGNDVPFESGVEAGLLLPVLRQAFLAPLLALGLAEAAGRYHNGEPDGFAFHFRRGFVEDLEVFGAAAAARFIERAQRLFALTPLRHVRFLPDRSMPGRGGADPFAPLRLPALAALVRLPEVARLRAIDLRGNQLGDGAAWTLLGSPHLGPQTILWMGGNGIGRESEQALRERFGASVNFTPRPPEPPAYQGGAGDDDIPF